MKNILSVCALFLVSGVAFAEQVLDINKIAGKSESEIAAYLGNPQSCEPNKYGKKCQYKKAETEIVYINKKADWITVEAIYHLPYNENILIALGLKASKPKFKNENVLRWELTQGLLEVAVFKGTSSSDYAHIKVATK